LHYYILIWITNLTFLSWLSCDVLLGEISWSYNFIKMYVKRSCFIILTLLIEVIGFTYRNQSIIHQRIDFESSHNVAIIFTSLHTHNSLNMGIVIKGRINNNKLSTFRVKRGKTENSNVNWLFIGKN